MFSSSPKLGTAIGGLGAYMHTFDEKSRVSLFGVSYQVHLHPFANLQHVVLTSSGAYYHRTVVLTVFGHIENDYDDYLGTGEPLRTEDDSKAFAGRYHG